MTALSARMTTICSPANRRCAIRLAARPTTSPEASITVGDDGVEGTVGSGKESHPLAIRVALHELGDGQGRAAGGVNLRPRLRRVGDRPDGEWLGQMALGEKLAGDHDCLAGLGQTLEVPDVEWKHLMAGTRQTLGGGAPDRGLMGPGGLLELDDDPGELRVFLANSDGHARRPLDPGPRYKRCRKGRRPGAHPRRFGRPGPPRDAGALGVMAECDCPLTIK